MSQACGLAVAAAGGVALIGWLINARELSGVRTVYIPMAPNTAVAFIALGLALAATSFERPRTMILVRAAAALVLVLALTRLFEYVTHKSIGIDGLFIQSSGESLGLAPVGKMALLTAMSLTLAAGAALLTSV